MHLRPHRCSDRHPAPAPHPAGPRSRRAARRPRPVSPLALAAVPALLALAGCGGGGDEHGGRLGGDGLQVDADRLGPRRHVLAAGGATPPGLPAAAASPSAFAPTVYDPAAPDKVTIGTIVVGDTRYNNVVISWGQLLAAGTAPPATSWNQYDPATNRVTLPRVQLGETTYTNVVVTLGGVVSVGGTEALSPVIPNDPLFADQWHLLNTGQAGPDGKPGLAGEDLRVTMAWNHATGAGIRIAVVDDGLDVSHEDFDIVPGKSWDYRVNAYGDPSSKESSHGTSCGALAGAKGFNGIGVTGVAFNARMVGYNLLQASMDTYGADAVVKDLADNHIYTNSYGAPDGSGALHPATQAWRDAIDQGTSQGRGGKGAIYTWAAGNGAPADRSDHDGQANYQGVFAIGSLNDQGKRSSYSEPGSNILVMGYGGEQCEQHTMTSADVMGTDGYNNGSSAKKAGDTYSDYSGKPNYTRCVNGTSSATPEVAGVAALMIELNPNLGWRDVRAILARTARQNDAGDSDWLVNAAGLKINHQYGFGAADAAAAVAMARGWTNLPAQKTATATHGDTSAIGNTAQPLTSTLALTGSGITKIEFVHVLVDADTAEIGNLSITLVSPGGTSSTLSLPRQCMDVSDSSNPKPVPCGKTLAGGFRFGVVRLMDEAADGTWKLQVSDQTGAASSLTRWSLKVYGH